MPRHRMQVRVRSYGIYSAWTGDHRQIPDIVRFTTEIPARPGIEFGYVLHISGGKGRLLDYEIEHPPWQRPDGKREPPFTGSFGIKQNDFDFFLGDTIWEPWQEKCGPWTLRTRCEGELLAEQVLLLLPPERLAE